MPAPISVIIPTLNSAKTLPACLGALSEALTEGLIAEVIFTDGGSTDDTEQIADEVGAVFISGPKGRGNQMAMAAAVAKGEWLLFLHADSVFDNGWTDGIPKHLSDPEKAGYFRLRFDEPSSAAKLVAFWANTRSRLFSLPYGDQGLLISRQLYNRVDGYDRIPLMEDVAMAGKLRRNLVGIPITVETSAEKYRNNGYFKRSIRNFSILMQYLAGADPQKLAEKYYR